MNIYVVALIAGLVLWAVGLWLRGFFGIETSQLERKLYWLRVAIWFTSIMLVAWPLQLFRARLGSVAYVAIAFAILALFYWLGIAASKALVRRHEAADQ